VRQRTELADVSRHAPHSGAVFGYFSNQSYIYDIIYQTNHYQYGQHLIKSVSSKFINEQKLMRFHFNWQDGYGVFTCSHSQITAVSNYIRKQPAHHSKQTFREEYLHFLEKFEIEYDERYLFEWVD
jgi:hypothetical protein